MEQTNISGEKEMKNPIIRRCVTLFLAVMLLISGACVHTLAEDGASEPTVAETDPTEEATESTEETGETEPEATEEPETEATVETTEPSEVPTDPSEATEAPTEEETLPPEETAAPMEELAEPLTIAEEPEKQNTDLYFGQLHAHSSFSSGTKTPEALFASARESGMDFFTITDHGDSLALEPSCWETGKAAAEAAADGNFVGIYGFEMSWPERLQIGHIGTFATVEFQSWDQPEYKSYASGLQNYYTALSAVPGAIGQWNHPGNQYGTFSGFDHYSEDTDRVIHLMEAGGAYEKYYSRALDKGWHIAPANGEDSGRTVIHAQTLTEEALYEAIRHHRVYTTEDSDLEIGYVIDGYPMGSILKKRQVGETVDIQVSLYDPTDVGIGLVEVVVDGGKTLARQTVESAEADIRFSLAPEYRYYYLRITQPDGDVALTAPIWMEAEEHLGISGLRCETEVPVQNEDVTLVLDVFNGEKTEFLVDSLEILADGVPVSEDESLTSVPGERELSHRLTFCYDGIGQTEITVRLSGTLEGDPREYEASLTLSFRLSQQVTDVVIDGAHGNAGLEELNLFSAMAAAEDIRTEVVSGDMTEDVLKTSRFLVVATPEEPFSEAFLDVVSAYVHSGGSLLLCGPAAAEDDAAPGRRELNRLLEAAGAALRLGEETLTDSVMNGGKESLLYLQDIAADSSWCSGLAEGQVYRHADGCPVDPGQGHILVRSGTSPVLAWEETAVGGTIFAAGGLLIGDMELKEPAGIWDLPYANRTIAENLLGIGGKTLPLSTIRQAREADTGTLRRIRGYVTAGTANPRTRFPETLYLQDDTGGIAVIPVTEEDIAVGTPVEITGTAELRDGNRILKCISLKVLDDRFYRYIPATGSWKELLDPKLHGGELVEVEGQCTAVTLTEGVVSGITLQDSSGNLADILVEPYILSAATGRNDLHEKIQKGETVRAAGILHVDAAGNAVIRVRNCEEVVCIPPQKQPAGKETEYVNPKTDDWLAYLIR